MEKSSEQAGALVDLRYVASYLGQPLESVRRWIHKPPPGFPGVVRIGIKITVRKLELERWASGEVAFTSSTALPRDDASTVPRRGRPRSLPAELESFARAASTPTRKPARNGPSAAALSPAQLQEVQAALTELSELDVLPFETLTGQFEPQPYQLVGPLELAPAVDGVSYTLITHWRSVRDAAKWLESEPYARLGGWGRVTSQTFVPYKEVNERDFLRSDKLQRDWVLDGA